MSLSVDVDLRQLTKAFDRLGREAPFAMALAMTKTAQQAQIDATAVMVRDLDKPTPFTQKAIGITKATKTNPVAHVFIKDKQADYLKFQIEGGTRVAERGKPVIIAHHKHRNKYGNLPRNKLRRLRQQGKLLVFDDGMIAQRTKRGFKPVAFQSTQATYDPKFDFFNAVMRSANRNGKFEAIKAIRYVLQSAGPS